jgi:DNA-binding beta-propeller fold protein YncE
MARALALLLIVVPLCAAARFDDGARYAFVPASADNSVYVVDLEDRTLAHVIRLESFPDSIATSERLKALIVSHAAERRLTLVDLSSGELERIDYPLGLHPVHVAVSPPGESLLVYDSDVGRLEVHDLRQRKILLAADDVVAHSEPVFSADGTSIYWSDNTAGTFNAIDLWSSRKSVKLGGGASGGTQLSAASRSVDGTLAFVSDTANNVVHIVDLARFRPVSSTSVGRHPGRPWGTTDGRYMLVPNRGDGTVTAISASTGAARYTVPAVEDPVAIHPGWLDTTAAVIGATGQLAFLDIDSGDRVARMELDGEPRAGVVTSDSRTLAVPLHREPAGQVAIFDMRSRSHEETIGGLGGQLGPASLAISNNLCH